jgi:hypothetical protein
LDILEPSQQIVKANVQYVGKVKKILGKWFLCHCFFELRGYFLESKSDHSILIFGLVLSFSTLHCPGSILGLLCPLILCLHFCILLLLLFAVHKAVTSYLRVCQQLKGKSGYEIARNVMLLRFLLR